jgi:hypothetical protein
MASKVVVVVVLLLLEEEDDAGGGWVRYSVRFKASLSSPSQVDP